MNQIFEEKKHSKQVVWYFSFNIFQNILFTPLSIIHVLGQKKRSTDNSRAFFFRKVKSKILKSLILVLSFLRMTNTQSHTNCAIASNVFVM